jgi:two-component system C4-dicarboxylate transport sensor histidine kinase DctB
MDTAETIQSMSGAGDISHEHRLQQLGAEVARVAHELNTPVSLIAGSLSNLDQHVSALLHYVSVSRAYIDEHPELARAYAESRMDYVLTNSMNLLAICDEGVGRLRYIAGQLRGYGRRGDSPVNDEGIDLVDLVHRAERMARSAHPVMAVTEWVATESLRVAAEEQTLLQALVNIIGNAFDAVTGRPAPRVCLSVRLDESERAEVRVSDNGPGVPADLREKVFTPFFTTKRPGSGVGLGLAIALEALERLGGSLELGDLEPGAEFILRLPVA